MFPDTQLLPFPPLDDFAREYVFPDALTCAPFPNEAILEKELEEEAVLYDISNFFNPAFHSQVLTFKFLSYLDQKPRFSTCFSPPLKGNYAIHWDTDHRDEQISSLVREFMPRERVNPFMMRGLERWLAPQLWICGLKDILSLKPRDAPDRYEQFRMFFNDAADEISPSHSFHPSPHHFEQLFVCSDNCTETVHFSRFKSNCVYLDRRNRAEKFFVSFFHKAVFHLSENTGNFYAYMLLHRHVIPLQNIPYLLQFQPESMCTFNPYPPITTPPQSEIFFEVLEQALDAQTTPMEDHKSTLLPVQILDCTAKFLEQMSRDPSPPLSDEQLLDMFQMETERLSSFFIQADFTAPETEETPTDWLKKTLAPWLSLKEGDPSPLFAPLITWFCQCTDGTLLHVFQDPNEKKQICSYRPHLHVFQDPDEKTKICSYRPRSYVYLHTLSQNALVSTILKTNYVLTIVDNCTKHGGYFSMLRMATFDSTTHTIEYKIQVIVHPNLLNEEEVQQLFQSRAEGRCDPVIFLKNA